MEVQLMQPAPSARALKRLANDYIARARKLTTVMLLMSLLYGMVVLGHNGYRRGMFSQWTLRTLPLRVGEVLGVVVTFILVIVLLVVLSAAAGRLAGQYVSNGAPEVKRRLRVLSAAVFLLFMLIVAVLSVFAGSTVGRPVGVEVPTAFWFAVPPSTTIGTLPHLDGWGQKVACLLLGAFVYSIVSVLTFWFESHNYQQTLYLWLVLFDKNDVYYLYAVAGICGLSGELIKQVLAFARFCLASMKRAAKRISRVFNRVIRLATRAVSPRK